MNFSKISINGYRGFASERVLEFAIPNDSIGSGLTVVVGANNSGKSTIFESIRAVTQTSPPSFSEVKRNKSTNEHISISLFDDATTPNYISLKTLSDGGSETEFKHSVVIESIKIAISERF